VNLIDFDELYRPIVIDLFPENLRVMIDMKAFEKMALSFPHTEQVPHFERVGFKITGRRMFTTYLEKDNTANIFLTPAEQGFFVKWTGLTFIPFQTSGEKRERPLLNSRMLQGKL